MVKNKEKPVIYTIVVFAPVNVQKKFQKLKDSFDLPSSTCLDSNHCILKNAAHFAIKRTFTLKSGVSEKDLITQLLKIKKFPNLMIKCSKSDVFVKTNYGDVIYLQIDKNTGLIKLHKIIKLKIDNLVNTKNLEMEGDNYLPHITAVYGVPKTGSNKIKGYIDTNILPLSFCVKQLFLLKEFDLIKDEREIVYIKSLV